MIEITNLKRVGELNLGFKDKNGKPINFTYGTVLTDKMVDTKVLEESMEKGTLSIFAKKNWVVFKKINVQGAIIGSPQSFTGLTPQEVEKINANKNTAIIPPDNYLDTLIPEIPPTVVNQPNVNVEVKEEVVVVATEVSATEATENVEVKEEKEIKAEKSKKNKTVKADKVVETTEENK